MTSDSYTIYDIMYLGSTSPNIVKVVCYFRYRCADVLVEK